MPRRVSPTRDHPRSRGEYRGLQPDHVPALGSSPLSRGILAGCAGRVGDDGIIPALAGNTAVAGLGAGTAWDHPRSRGEYATTSGTTSTPRGSSPLSRGIQYFGPKWRNRNRIIPALAGNTSSTPTKPTPVWDHPRSRGEYPGRSALKITQLGSSPLSRGIQGVAVAGGDGPGIIPALAGNTRDGQFHDAGYRDHPRSRGEYILLPRSLMACLGSSPLSRGIPPRLRRRRHHRRIIPALAGNTDAARRSRRATTDHPRSRGEYRCGCGIGPGVHGSSPLSRGIRSSAPRPLAVGRIIPALAGNTRADRHHHLHIEDHPRSRGEYRPIADAARRWAGSSPLSRGIRAPAAPLAAAVGIIPALAGNTRRGGWWPPACRDHPRSRGEYSLGVGDHAAGGGSSPLSRGIPAQVLEAEDLLGIIPALAGNTAPRPG